MSFILSVSPNMRKKNAISRSAKSAFKHSPSSIRSGKGGESVVLYRRGKQEGGKKTHIVRYSAEEVRGLPDRTDWEWLKNLTEEELEAAIASDPDSDVDVDWSKAVLVVPPSKKAVSIRLDADVLEFFRETGKGYQTRINAVLRRFVQAASRKK